MWSNKLAALAVTAMVSALLAPVFAQNQPLRLKSPEELARDQERAARILGRPEIAQIAPPDDVASPPDGAVVTESGLAYVVLEPGQDGPRPDPNARAELHYTGWNAEGVTIDTTREPEPSPRTLNLRTTVVGFREAVMTLQVGGKIRAWIPEELAYPGAIGGNKGQLTFDIELLSFVAGPTPPEDLAGVPDDATVTESGLAYRVLEHGEGEHPGPRDMIVADFHVWRTDGTLLDTTGVGENPALFQLDRTLPGFAEAFPMMVPGDRWLLWLPEELARAEDTSKVDPLTVIDVAFIRSVAPPEKPMDMRRPPADAVQTISGLAYKVLREGEGTRKPKFGETVEVAYAGWTTDGKRFDSSYEHGANGVFAIDHRKPLGWNEALMGMVEGEKRVVWIPEELAYGGMPGRPAGMLVFTIELVAIAD